MANIILVDDSMIIRKAFTRLLADKGHKILAEGKNGNEAIELYKQHSPDVMLLDLTMPNKGGREALEEIMEYDPMAKIIIFSSVTNPDTRAHCLEVGAKSFINKDVNFNDEEKKVILLNEIDRVLKAA